MNLKSLLSWLILIALITPLLAHSASAFLPFYDTFIVTSGSMEPEIQTGALLFTHSVSADKIEVGDTITFRQGSDTDSYTTHKVIDIESTDPILFQTQGIANEAPDPASVNRENLVGKKLFSIPLIGYIINWAGTTNGLIILILIPAVILTVIELRRIVRNINS